MVLLFECGKYAEQNTAATNQNHFWHWIRNLGRITQSGRKSRSTTTEYRIPPSRKYQSAMASAMRHSYVPEISYREPVDSAPLARVPWGDPPEALVAEFIGA